MPPRPCDVRVLSAQRLARAARGRPQPNPVRSPGSLSPGNYPTIEPGDSRAATSPGAPANGCSAGKAVTRHPKSLSTAEQTIRPVPVCCHLKLRVDPGSVRPPRIIRARIRSRDVLLVQNIVDPPKQADLSTNRVSLAYRTAHARPIVAARLHHRCRPCAHRCNAPTARRGKAAPAAASPLHRRHQGHPLIVMHAPSKVASTSDHCVDAP